MSLASESCSFAWESCSKVSLSCKEASSSTCWLCKAKEKVTMKVLSREGGCQKLDIQQHPRDVFELYLQVCRAGSTVSQSCLQLCSLGTCCQYLSMQAVALFLTPAALSSQCLYVNLLMTTILLTADKSELLKRCFSLPAMQVQVRS
jgi:hypothetical protein